MARSQTTTRVYMVGMVLLHQTGVLPRGLMYFEGSLVLFMAIWPITEKPENHGPRGGQQLPCARQLHICPGTLGAPGDPVHRGSRNLPIILPPYMVAELWADFWIPWDRDPRASFAVFPRGLPRIPLWGKVETPWGPCLASGFPKGSPVRQPPGAHAHGSQIPHP